MEFNCVFAKIIVSVEIVVGVGVVGGRIKEIEIVA